MSTTPAGWYPQDDGSQRYWDGLQWTEHVAPRAATEAAGTSAAGAAGSSSAPITNQVPAQRPWFKKKRFIIPGALVGLLVIGSALSSGGDDKSPALTDASKVVASAQVSQKPTGAATTSPASAPTPTATPKPVAPKPAAPKLTVAQENAKGAAEDYLDYSGFSKKGLIKQLEFEGYKAKDIAAALATMKVDWNAEAVESAQAYVDMSHFSRSGLVKQLQFEGYTSKQATQAATAVGL